ncbi:phenylalanine--tRNA ligase beta subunit-related protein, partial [Klebsiella pneumoniae]|uniref:phenylalanine--tRNA ligase beta subunit-related protein n=1 Tax=Klebsiella pneumoniae TaxID=573 RepID=UPI001D0E9742
MKNRLLHSGITSHSFLVDVSNYVMLELGQPIHIYDAKQIKNTLHARYAKDKEIINCLNDKTIALEKDTLVIADDNGPISIAGIIGSQSTAVNKD